MKIFEHKRAMHKIVSAWAAFATLFTSFAPAFAAPTTLLGGNAVLEQVTRAGVSFNGDSLAQISSTSRSAVLDWSKFNVGTGQMMDFDGAGTTFFNLVDGAAGKSQIDGIISGNGSVWVINPSGIAFGAGSQVYVDGLFAAAAGTLANADALRDGSSLLPEFSSFGGTVTTDANSTFMADQVALMGKTVSAAGDFLYSGDLQIGAANRLVVDTVGDGKVSINLADFAPGAGETGLELGDLTAYNLTAVSDRAIEVNGDVTAYDSLDITANGDLDISGSAVAVNGDLYAGSVNGSLTLEKWAMVSANGDWATVSLESVRGDVRVDGEVAATGGYANICVASATAADAQGDVVINGFVHADTAYNLGCVDVLASTGSGATGSVVVNGTIAADDTARVAADSGDVSVNGSIKANCEAKLYSKYTGDINISKSAAVVATGVYEEYGDVFNAKVDLWSGAWSGGSGGNIRLEGTVTADGEKGTLDFQSRNGSIAVPGALNARGLSSFVAMGGHLVADNYQNKLAGTVAASANSISLVNGGELSLGNVSAWTGDLSAVATGDLIVNDDAQIVTHGDGVNLALQSLDGDVLVKGDVVAKGFGSHVSVGASPKAGANGNIVIDGSVRADAQYGLGVVNIGVTAKGTGSVVVNGSVAADGYMNLMASSGDVRVNGEAMSNLSALVLARSGDIVIGKNARVEVSGAYASLDPSLFAAQMQITSASQDGSHGDVVIDGNVCVGGEGGLLDVNAGLGADASGTVTVNGKIFCSDTVMLGAQNGDIIVADTGVVSSDGNGDIWLDNQFAIGLEAKDTANKGGDVIIDGKVLATGMGTVAIMTEAPHFLGKHSVGNGDVIINGTVMSQDGMVFVTTGIDDQTTGDVIVSGDIFSGREIFLNANEGSVKMMQGSSVDTGKAILLAGCDDGRSGTIEIAGSVKARDEIDLMAGGLNNSTGGIRMEKNGQVSVSHGNVYARVSNGNITQSDAMVASASNGFVPPVSLQAAFVGETVNLMAENGSVGGGSNYVVVDGKAYARADGDIAVAACDEQDLLGGNYLTEHKILIPRLDPDMIRFDEISFGKPDGTSHMIAGRDLHAYTAGRVESGGLFQAARDVTIAAAEFGNASYLRAGGKLTLNNVGEPGSTQIAYFEGGDSQEPNIVNQPNAMAIFLNGRLAGGNLQTITKFGTDESFLVATPELKSTQGIFGSPVFLHSDLDVANSVEVNVIDYLIQDVPRLTLASDFPAEVDQNVEAVGLSQKDIYWFGLAGTAKDADAKGE